MLRAGMSLPAVMQLLGHKTIEMALRYIQVSQNDLQRQYQMALQNIADLHSMPKLTLPDASINTGIPAISQSLELTRHLLDMYRRQLSDDRARLKLAGLLNRLAKIAAAVRCFNDLEK